MIDISEVLSHVIFLAEESILIEDEKLYEGLALYNESYFFMAYFKN